MSRANPRFHRVNPPLPAVGGSNGTVEFIIQGVIELQMTISTFSYLGPVNAPTQLQLNNLLQAIRTNIFNTYRAAVSADWAATFTRITVTHRNDLASQQQNETALGTGPAGHEPIEVATVLIRRSGVKGQHGRGRLSLPAVPLAWVTNSQVTAALGLVAYANLSTQMGQTASDGTNTWVPAITQRSNVSPRLVIGAAPLAQQSVISQYLGTIRRRKIGRGK